MKARTTCVSSPSKGGGGGGQAIGLFIGAMWRKDEVPDIRANWPHIICKGSSDPWTCRRIGESIGLKS